MLWALPTSTTALPSGPQRVERFLPSVAGLTEPGLCGIGLIAGAPPPPLKGHAERRFRTFNSRST